MGQPPVSPATTQERRPKRNSQAGRAIPAISMVAHPNGFLRPTFTLNMVNMHKSLLTLLCVLCIDLCAHCAYNIIKPTHREQKGDTHEKTGSTYQKRTPRLH
nr:MAG TPA: hypothetical protein [Caudoviricetes sp.]